MKAKKISALILALILIIAVLPFAYADGEDADTLPEQPPSTSVEPTEEPSTPPSTVPTEAPSVEPTSAPTPTATAAPTPTATAAPAGPVITKQPTGESVKSGGSAMFIARAKDYSWCAWRFYDLQGNEVVFDNIWGYFPNLKVSGGNSEVFTIGDIPLEMNGWTVCCLFSNEDGIWTYSDAVRISVTAAATPSPRHTVRPSASPSPSHAAYTLPPQSAAPSLSPTPAPAASPVPEESGSTVALIIAAIVSLILIMSGVIFAILYSNSRKRRHKSRHGKK